MKLMGWQSVVLASKQQRAASNNQEVVEKKKTLDSERLKYDDTSKACSVSPHLFHS